MKMFVAVSLLFIGTVAYGKPKKAKVKPQKEVPAHVSTAKATAQLTETVMSKLTGIKSMSAKTKNALAERLHKALNTGKYLNRDEAVLLAAVAAIHSFDSEARYASFPLLNAALDKWPGLKQTKDAVELWNIFEENFANRDYVDELVLSSAAQLLDGEEIRSAKPEGFNYYRGVAYFQSGKYSETLREMSEVKLTSSNYRRAKFLEALSLIKQGNNQSAQEALQVVITLDPTDEEKSSQMTSKAVTRLRELGVLNQSRILYEQTRFEEAVASYRTLAQDSLFFYNSLNEQGWAFFLAGYPNRALGSLYSATSPFFHNRFNPEAYFLSAAVKFWLCDFDSSRDGLKAYVSHFKGEGDVLKSLLDRVGSLSADDSNMRFAKIVEDAHKGVSPMNLGIGRRTLNNLLLEEHIQGALKGLDSAVQKRERIQSKNSQYPEGKERLWRAMTLLESSIRKVMGAHVRNELATLNQIAQKTFSQSRILYLEILTAKKDLILGQGRSVKGTEFVGEERDFFEESAASQRFWTQDKNEFWYDELGHHVFTIKSQCQGYQTGS